MTRHGGQATDFTDCARSALERKSSVGATLLYGVRRLGAAFGELTTNRHEWREEEEPRIARMTRILGSA
jgi:hypothetical protein